MTARDPKNPKKEISLDFDRATIEKGPGIAHETARPGPFSGGNRAISDMIQIVGIRKPEDFVDGEHRSRISFIYLFLMWFPFSPQPA